MRGEGHHCTYCFTYFTNSLSPSSSVDEEDYSVRLVGGSREGIVEVALNGRWGTICEDVEWDVDNVEVVCDELGLSTEGSRSTIPSGRCALVPFVFPSYTISLPPFPSLLSPLSYIQYMSAVKPIWLSLVSCFPGDDGIEDCGRNFLLGYTTCNTANVFNSAEANCGMY